jgi:hypothetical protein
VVRPSVAPRSIVAVRPSEELAAFKGILFAVLSGGLFWLGLVKLVMSLT